jgi:hypothetical protein
LKPAAWYIDFRVNCSPQWPDRARWAAPASGLLASVHAREARVIA